MSPKVVKSHQSQVLSVPVAKSVECLTIRVHLARESAGHLVCRRHVFTEVIRRWTRMLLFSCTRCSFSSLSISHEGGILVSHEILVVHFIITKLVSHVFTPS